MENALIEQVDKSNTKNTRSQQLYYGLKYLSPYLSMHKKYFIPILTAMSIIASVTALTAYIFKYILDDIFIAKDEKMLTILPIVVILLFLIRGLSRFVSSYLTNKIGLSVANSLRNNIFNHLLYVKYASLQKITSGDIVALLVQTILNIQNIISKTIPEMIVSFLTVVALIVAILYTNWHLALYAICIGILIVVPIKILGNGVKRHTQKSEEMMSQITNSANETFNNIDLVKVYGKEHYEASLFLSFLNLYEKLQLKLAQYQLLSSPFMEFFIAVAVGVVIYIGGYSVIEGRTTPGDFFAFLIILTMLYAPIKNMTQNIMSIYMLNGYISRVHESLSLPLESDAASKQIINSIDSIRFDKVYYKIGESSILQDITFQINKGDRVAIVGHSGSGKSSIISLIFGLGKHSCGDILVNNKPIDEIMLSSMRDQISYVNQDAGVFNDTMQNNILYGQSMDISKYQNAKQQAQCGFIDLMPNKDHTVAGEFGKNLSGGQKQRIALARAIYRDGTLLVLDEATSALDANTEKQIQQSIEQIMHGRTSIVIAHRLSTIKQCNKVLILNKGTIVAYGDYDQVSKTDIFRKNFDN